METPELFKVVSIYDDSIHFEGDKGSFAELFSTQVSDHSTHYIDFLNSGSSYQDMLFDLSSQDKFIEYVEDYGIRLKPVNGHPIPVPGYSQNNGYYSHEMSLHLRVNGIYIFSEDVSSCQTF